VEHPWAVAASERVAWLAVAPLLAAYHLRLVSFETATQILSLLPGGAGLLVRRAWYRATLAHCGKRLKVGFGTVMRDPLCRIDDDCSLGHHNHVSLADIGPHFVSAHHVSIVAGTSAHRFEHRRLPMHEQPGPRRRVVIGEDVWVGAHAAILADVASHSVVGAGAVVTRTFTEWQILAGVPAKVLRTRP
jgi:acetyltransferase-like isoleucine patch superfamily enzyme